MRNSTVVKAIYNGNGVTRRWDIPFEYLDTSEIEVILTTVVDDINVEEHIPANEYTIDTSSGEVIYPADMSVAPVEEGKKVTIHRVTDLYQESDYTNQGALWPESVEASFDKVHQILQEHQEGIDRSVKVDITGNDDPQQYFNEIIETAKLGLIKAGEAIAAAENAAASEANAAASETSAANSAAAALASQQAAALSETHAATSETNAAASETTAVASANSATASQQAAALSAESASASKLSAESSAGTAVANAATSTSAAQTAQNAATTCSEVLPQVLGAASNVATKASAAAASATQAALSANAAETASQTAVNAAEDAQDAADDAQAAANAAAVSAGAAATSATQAETANTEAKYYAKITMDKIAESAVGYPSQVGTLEYTGQVQTPTWDVFYEPQKLTITGDTSATDAGTYTITMTPKPTYYWWDDDTTTAKTQTWTIGRAAITTPPSQSGVIVYDGTEQSPTWADYDSSKLTIGGDTAGTNAGTYTATFTPTANYKWADGTTTAKSVTWEISAATVTIPTVTDTSKTYNGGSQAPTVTGLDTQTVEVVDDATAINAGSYMITFRLKNASLKWSDGTTSDKSFAWTIGPKAVTAPTVTGTSFTYDGTSQGPTIGSYDTDAILVSGTTEAVGAGNYSVIFSLVSATNYKWSDETTEPKSVSWAINPATVAVPALSNKSKTYNGSAQSPTVSPYDSNLVEVTGITTATNAGSYTVTFHLLNPNVTWADETTADKTDTWEIAKAAGSLTLSKASVTLNTAQMSDTVTVTTVGDGVISATSSNTAIATATVSNGVVTITAVANGSASVTVAVAEGTNYLAPTSQTIATTVTLYQTMTVTINLSDSNPDTCCTYADDAVGMTPGSDAWDTFFGHYPVIFQNGVEGKKLQRNNFNLHEDGTSADITSGSEGDVMIAFPRRGLKMSKSGNIITISMTNNLDDTSFEFMAHKRGSTLKDKFYLGAYKGSEVSSKLRSLSGKTCATNKTIGAFRTLAQANGAPNGSGGSGYDQSGWYQLIYRQCMYILKYKSLNSQSKVGRGFVDRNSAKKSTGGTETKGMDWGETTGKEPMKLFGIEDFWGNVNELIDGCFSDSSRNIKTATENFNDTGSNYTARGVAASANISFGYMNNCVGDTHSGFTPTRKSGSETTYFCDGISLLASRMPLFGGGLNDASYAGAFLISFDVIASYADGNISARLMYV